MSSRDTILQRLRGELSESSPISEPAPVEVWPYENPTPTAMAERFAKELTEVHGEVIRCASIEEARRRLAELVKKSEWTALGAMDRAMVRQTMVDLPTEMVQWAASDWQPRRIAEFSASVIEADCLLADTGSCLISCPTTEDRLLCYLPPACVVIARVKQLTEHLPAAWPSIVARAADPTLGGEFLIVTGPSRTADIEKILILGVHGPKRLVVLLVE